MQGWVIWMEAITFVLLKSLRSGWTSAPDRLPGALAVYLLPQLKIPSSHYPPPLGDRSGASANSIQPQVSACQLLWVPKDLDLKMLAGYEMTGCTMG